MPIKIPNALPATETLLGENIFVITETRALTQDIRPLQIALLNLMPTKIVTETQFARLFGQHAFAGGAYPSAHQHPRGEKRQPRTPALLLQDLRGT